MPVMQEHAFGHMLRSLREQREATQADVAEAVRVSRATIAQWEGGRHLPSPDRVRSLDAFLHADGALTRLADQEREGTRPGDTADRLTLLDIVRRAEAALLERLQYDETGKPIGWCQDLQKHYEATPVSTAFGIKTAVLIDESSKTTLGALGDILRRMRMSPEGWGARTQKVPRPEAIAVVVDALVRVGPVPDLDEAVGMLRNSFDEVARQRPAVITTVLETVIDLRPRSEFAAELIRILLVSRRPCDGVLLWVEKNEDELVSPEPSVLHTARAVSVLARATSMGVVPADLEDPVAEALEPSVRWLRGQTRFENIVEIVIRRTRTGNENLDLRHFTPAWVVRALVLAGESPSHPTVVSAIREVRGAFDEDHGLWVWRNGDLPIWMTFDAVAALRLAALAAFVP